jgi:hypothetical protein
MKGIRKMKKMLLASVAVISLGLAVPTFAQDSGTANAEAGATIGATGGGATGAVVGGLLGGPIGAVIGGFTGAVIGAEAGVETATVDYVIANPVEPVVIDGSIDVGFTVPAGVTVHPIASDPAHGYIYANGRAWIVDLETNTVVQSPGYLISQSTADYAIANPVDPIEAEGDVVVGYVIPETATIATVPEDPNYGYVYINGSPVLVDNTTRTVIWTQ